MTDYRPPLTPGTPGSSESGPTRGAPAPIENAGEAARHARTADAGEAIRIAASAQGEARQARRGAGRPLTGRRVAITRPLEQAEELLRGVRELGGDAVHHAAIAIAPPLHPSALDAAVFRLEAYAWVVMTSANAARALGDRLRVTGRSPLPPHVRLAAVGPGTAGVVEESLGRCDFVARSHAGHALAAAVPVSDGDRVLFPRGDLAPDTVMQLLRERGATVDDVVVYRTVPGPGLDALCAEMRDGAIDAVLFASASAVRFTVEHLTRQAGTDASRIVGAGSSGHQTPHRPLPPTPWDGQWPPVFCLGPSTAAEARARGLAVSGVAEPHSVEGLLRVVAQWFTTPPDSLP